MVNPLALPPTADPDLQVTVNDFADYTEYFPSDLFRSLTLIRKLDEAYHEHTNKVHQLTKTYGSLPTLPTDQRPNPQDLRKDISLSLDRALRCRESSHAEAARLCSLTESLTTRLHSIRAKLEAQPRPPSREATPPPSRTRKAENDRTPRIKLTHDADAKKKSSTRTGRLSSRRIIVPGEVLPPRDPNSPSPSIVSESEPEGHSSPIARPAPRLLKLDKEKTPRPPKPEKDKIIKLPKIPKSRTPGLVGTNAHSQKVGISVSNAMAQLEPPPENPIPGSMHAPWLKLSEWELLRIRKSMKKNADWMPSDIMVTRYLEQNKRGRRNFEEAKRIAKHNGEEVLDEQPQAFVRPLLMPSRSTDVDITPEEAEKLAARGNRLNEGKKKKKAQMKAEQNMQQGIADVLADPSVPESEHHVPEQPAADTIDKKTNKKRKRDAGPDPEVLGAAIDPEVQPPPDKKIKLKPAGPSEPSDTATASDKTRQRQISLPRRGASQPPEPESSSTERLKPTPKRNAKPATTPNQPTPPPNVTNSTSSLPPPPPPTTASTRRSTIKLNVNPRKALSAEPEKPRIPLRRTSDAGPEENKAHARSIALNTETAASRRGKRAAPGLLTSHPDERGARTSVAGRKRIRGEVKGGIDAGADAGADTAMMELDPNEPLYCYCRGPSAGQMIACENAECPIEWFHVLCAGLEEVAKSTRLSRLTWFCLNCRAGNDCDQETGIANR